MLKPGNRPGNEQKHYLFSPRINLAEPESRIFPELKGVLKLFLPGERLPAYKKSGIEKNGEIGQPSVLKKSNINQVYQGQFFQ